MVEEEVKAIANAPFDHIYEPPRDITDERERRMAQKMIKVVDQAICKQSAAKEKLKQMYIQSDELAWLGEHCNRDSDDVEMIFKNKRAQITKMRD